MRRAGEGEDEATPMRKRARPAPHEPPVVVDLTGCTEASAVTVDLTGPEPRWVPVPGWMGRHSEAVEAALAGDALRSFVVQCAEARAPSAARLRAVPAVLHPVLAQVLVTQGRDTLYEHQVAALERWMAPPGDHLVMSTPTGSGKTLAMHLPLFDTLLRDPAATAIVLLPLLALADDQHASFARFASAIDQHGGRRLTVAKLYGSTPTSEVFGQAVPAVVLATPDKLHHALAHTQKNACLAAYLRSLRVVVLDEAHSYSAVFGGNMAHLLRRLRNACAHAGNEAELRFVLLSATISNPVALTCDLCGVPRDRVALVDDNSAVVHRQTVVVTRHATGGDTGPFGLVCTFLGALPPLKTLVFVDSVAQTCKFADAINKLPGRTPCARPFHSSLSTHDKREVLRQFVAGMAVSVLVSTSCLEAGVDFPDVDCAIIVGYPGQMNLRQRMGRCGRTRPSLVIFVPRSASLFDAYIEEHPLELTRLPMELLVLSTMEELSRAHVRCAVAEVGAARRACFQPHVVDDMLATGELAALADGSLVVAGPKFPRFAKSAAWAVSFRGASPEHGVRIVDEEGRTLEADVGRWQAFFRCFPGGVFFCLHDGRVQRFRSLSMTTDDAVRENNVCQVVSCQRERARRDSEAKRLEYDRAIKLMDDLRFPWIESSLEPPTRALTRRFELRLIDGHQSLGVVSLVFGDTVRRDTLRGYMERPSQGEILATSELVRYCPIDGPACPTTTTLTQLLTFRIDDALAAHVSSNGARPAVHIWLHSLVHAVLKVCPLLCVGGVQDVVECAPDPRNPREFHISDVSYGGNGFCAALFARFPEALAKAAAMMESCARRSDSTHGTKACVICLALPRCPGPTALLPGFRVGVEAVEAAPLPCALCGASPSVDPGVQLCQLCSMAVSQAEQ